MELDAYPPQEPLSAAGQAYGDECWARGAGLVGEELPYGPDPCQRLLVHRPQAATGPLLLFWHGGGWTSGYKEWMRFMAPAFTAAGVVFVTAGYRLAPAHLFPDALEDCAAAIRLVRSRCAAWGADPAQVHVGGHSAGGHYAALLGVSEHWRSRFGLTADSIAGVLPLSGVFQFGDGSGLTMRPRFLGASPDAETLASPLHFVETAPAGGRFPAFLVAWGSRDFAHLMDQGDRFVAALERVGADVERLVMADRTHFTASFAGGEADGPWVPRALALMTRLGARAR